MITKLQKACLFVFVLYNIFDTLVTSYAIGFLGGQEWSPFLRHFSSEPFLFVLAMVAIKSFSIYFFYKLIVMCNLYDPDHPDIRWNSLGNFVAAAVLSLFPVWMIGMVFLNWPLG